MEREVHDLPSPTWKERSEGPPRPIFNLEKGKEESLIKTKIP